jgi:predicted RNA-binding Zn-ribbon protein involved in translation (DUF1610 family)
MLKEPQSMDECLYFTRRTEGDKGHIMAWALKKKCPKCGKALMGKPKEDGKTKIRAKEYVCPECGFTEEKTEHENGLILSVRYTCPKCEFKGETQIPFRRKAFQGVQAFVFECSKCNEKIPITKKMKKTKGGKASALEEDDDV